MKVSEVISPYTSNELAKCSKHERCLVEHAAVEKQ